jgi:hypothetical protein
MVFQHLSTGLKAGVNESEKQPAKGRCSFPNRKCSSALRDRLDPFQNFAQELEVAFRRCNGFFDSLPKLLLAFVSLSMLNQVLV